MKFIKKMLSSRTYKYKKKKKNSKLDQIGLIPDIQG